MRKLEFLTGNWGLKILALVLAVVIYHAIKYSSVTSDRTKRNNDRIVFQTP